MAKKKEISNNILAILVVVAVVFSIVSTVMLWSAVHSADGEGLNGDSPDTNGEVSVDVVPLENETENMTEGGEGVGE